MRFFFNPQLGRLGIESDAATTTPTAGGGAGPLLPPPTKNLGFTYVSVFLEKLSLPSTVGMTKPALIVSVYSSKGQLVELSQVIYLTPFIFSTSVRTTLRAWSNIKMCDDLSDDRCLTVIFLCFRTTRTILMCTFHSTVRGVSDNVSLAFSYGKYSLVHDGE